MKINTKITVAFAVVFFLLFSMGNLSFISIDSITDKVIIESAADELALNMILSSTVLNKLTLTETEEELNSLKSSYNTYSSYARMWADVLRYGSDSEQFRESDSFITWMESGNHLSGMVIKTDLSDNGMTENMYELVKHIDEESNDLIKVVDSLTNLKKLFSDLYADEKALRYSIKSIIQTNDQSLLAPWTNIDYSGEMAIQHHNDKKYLDGWKSNIQEFTDTVQGSESKFGDDFPVLITVLVKHRAVVEKISEVLLNISQLENELEDQKKHVEQDISQFNNNKDAMTGLITNSVTQIRSNVQSIFLFLFAFLLLSAILIGVTLSRSILGPIRTLRSAVLKIGKGDLDVTMPLSGDDEISLLAKSFNNMRNEIKSSQAHLQKYSSDLEKAVKKRTAELNNKVGELEGSKIAMLNMMGDLKESMERQKRLEKIKSQFLSVTSHELRTPITPMKAQVQLILNGYMGAITEEQKGSLNMVLKNADRLDKLIGDILDLSKLESGNFKFIRTYSSISVLLKDVVETMSLKADIKNIKLSLKKAKFRKFMFDKDRLFEVIANLINNSIKFTPENGTIKIKAENKGNYAEISVEDSGIGISQKDLQRIFKPFEQADSSNSRKFEGSGLGLAISKAIVDAHGGKIWVTSKEGKGSVFTFTIPFKHAESKTQIFNVN